MLVARAVRSIYKDVAHTAKHIIRRGLAMLAWLSELMSRDAKASRRE